MEWFIEHEDDFCIITNDSGFNEKVSNLKAAERVISKLDDNPIIIECMTPTEEDIMPLLYPEGYDNEE
jgi:hypothetical protein